MVITDVNTGEVRALVTYPSYDNNKLSGTVDAAYYNQLQNDLSLPLYNNATQAKKAPGSTFKPITAIAGLEEGVIGLYDQINCTGLYNEVEPPIKCWIHPGQHGPLNVVGGIQNSCNYFFYEAGIRTGMPAIDAVAKDLGLGEKTGVELFLSLIHI